MSDQGERDERRTETSDGREADAAASPEAEDVKVAPVPEGKWEGELFDGAGAEASDPRYQAPSAESAGPAKPGKPSSGNWQMPEWMADESSADAKLNGPVAEGGRSRLGLYAGVGLLVVALLAAVVVYLLKGRNGDDARPAGSKPAARPVQESAVAMPADKPLQRFPGRPSKVLEQMPDAQSGLSYPLMARPWQVPTKRNKLGISGWSGQQILVTERSAAQLWYGQLLTGMLPPALRSAYKGPRSVKPVAGMAAKRYETTYYQFPHKTTPLASQALTVDGREGWLVVSYLTYKRSGVKATGEVVATAVIDTGRAAPAVAFMSLPNTHRAMWPDVNRFLSGLKVTSVS
jgi:hypothetical protein